MHTSNTNHILTTIVTNGQPGAGAAGLDWAIAHDLSHGGWCSKLPSKKSNLQAKYDLQETPSTGYLNSLAANVRDSDATIVFTLTPELSTLGMHAMDAACAEVKPILHFRPSVHPKWIASFIARNNVNVLHIVGAREIAEPGIFDFVMLSLDLALRSVRTDLLVAA